MFARRRDGNVPGEPEPEAEDAHPAALAGRIEPLLQEHLLHFAAVVEAEVERQEAHEGAKEP